MAQVAPSLPGGKQPRDQGINAAVRDVGIERDEAQRAVKIASIDYEAKAAMKKAGLDNNQSAHLEAARAAKAEQAAKAAKIIHRRACEAWRSDRGE